MPTLTNISIPSNTAVGTLSWMENFSAVLTASPTTYGFNAATAVDVANVVTAFRNAYDVAGVVGRSAVNPAGYTKPQRAALFAARDAALALIRPMAFEIHANAAVSDEDKLQAGVVPRNFSSSPIVVPGTNPVLGLQFASMGAHTLSYADSTTPASKRKPFGAIGLQLFVGIDSVVTPLSALRYYGTFTRNPAVVAFDPQDSGKIATYAARWVGKRGDEGPWSATLDAVVMFSQMGLEPVS